jgi:hypothetical protein
MGLAATVIGFGASSGASVTNVIGSSPNVLMVAPQPPPGGFTSIQAAVDAASPGDWILVAPGVYHEKGFNPTNGPSKPPPAGVYITKPNVHIRGMSRTGVIVDGTNVSATQGPGTLPAGSPACSSDPAVQDPGLMETDGLRHTREGILVWKTSGVSIENLTSCNSMSNEIWWDNGDGSGIQSPMALHGDYLTATSTFYKDKNSPSAQYGIFTSNVEGPGVIDHSYANNMTDSSYYIGACRDCNQVLNHPHAEYSALGLSTTNAGGNLLVENGEWDKNRTGMVSNAQNNDDAPSPQYGQCVPPSTPPAGAGPNSCDLWTRNYIHDNNNQFTPGSGLTAVSAIGTGIELAATQHISVVSNTIVNQGSWGVVTHDFPDPEQGPAGCQGGINDTNSGVCTFFSRGNYVANNQFTHDGYFGNPTNSDIANQASGQTCAPSDTYCGSPPQADPNCFSGNTDTSTLSEDPTGLQEAPCPPGSSDGGVLTAQLVCATDAGTLFNPNAGCPALAGFNYPKHTTPVQCNASDSAVLTPATDSTNGVCFLTLGYTLSPAVSPTMPDPCAGVPTNAFCPDTTAGMLRVVSSPPQPTQILVDGQIADTWGLTWVKVAPGSHTVCFAHVEGYTEPACQSANVTTGATTTVTGTFTQRGSLRVVTSPMVRSQIKVDGNPTDDWGMWTDVPTGSHTVCFGAVAGFNPPGCQTVTVNAGALTTVTGSFTSNPSATGQSGVGVLRAVTSPAVPSQITIKPSAGSPYIADSWGLTGLELPPGSYTVSFSHVTGWTEPAPQTITITAGNTTTVTGAFTQRGFLRVTTSPAAPGTIAVDGVPRNDWGMWTDIPTGSHTVCFGGVAGYASTPPCQPATVNPGVETDVTGVYS